MPFSIFSQAQISPAADPVDWFSGIIGKVQKNQLDSYSSGNVNSVPRVHFPTNYLSSYVNTDSFPGSMYYKLLNFKWFKGLQIDCEWGNVELTSGNYTWTKYDDILDTVEALASKGLNGADKKVIFLINWKTFSIDDASRALPAHLMTTGTAYAADFPRYTQGLFGYISTSVQDVASTRGYHFRFADLRDSQTNAFKTAFKNYIQAAYTHFKDHPCFGGFMTIEPSPVTRSSGGQTVPSAADASEYDRDLHFQGRLEILKWMRGIMTNHMLVEAGNHDNQWETDMMGSGTGVDGCLANHIGATGPNLHLGTNLHGIYDAVTNLAGKVPIIVQCQPQDTKSKCGNIRVAGIESFYDWRYDDLVPPLYNTSGPNPWGPEATGDAIDNNDPVTSGDYIIRRAIFLKANILSYQMDTSTGNPFNWDDFEFYMNNTTTEISVNTGGNIKLDPAGGMFIARPQFIV